jgi:copper homeostasis protein
MNVLLEVCVSSPDDAFVAAEAGADRVELNRKLSVGGLTPSVAAVRWVSSSLSIPLVATICPRTGGYVYSRAEVQDMAKEIGAIVAAGAKGVVIGALTPGDMLDVMAMKEFVSASSGAEVICHRAFDRVGNRAIELERLIGLGVSRVLTSGGAGTAPEGADELARLVQQSRGRIGILPGGGIKPSNMAGLIRATGCTQIHGSFSNIGPDGEPVVDPDQVQEARRILDGI